jgi:hypothetical protein
VEHWHWPQGRKRNSLREMISMIQDCGCESHFWFYLASLTKEKKICQIRHHLASKIHFKKLCLSLKIFSNVLCLLFVDFGVNSQPTFIVGSYNRVHITIARNLDLYYVM